MHGLELGINSPLEAGGIWRQCAGCGRWAGPLARPLFQASRCPGPGARCRRVPQAAQRRGARSVKPQWRRGVVRSRRLRKTRQALQCGRSLFHWHSPPMQRHRAAIAAPTGGDEALLAVAPGRSCSAAMKRRSERGADAGLSGSGTFMSKRRTARQAATGDPSGVEGATQRPISACCRRSPARASRSPARWGCAGQCAPPDGRRSQAE